MTSLTTPSLPYNFLTILPIVCLGSAHLKTNRCVSLSNNKVLNTIMSNIFIWIIIVIVAFTIASNFSSYEQTKNVTYNEYKELVDNRKIKVATITGNHFKGELREELTLEDENGTLKEYNFISIELPELTIDQTEAWVDGGIEVKIQPLHQ